MQLAARERVDARVRSGRCGGFCMVGEEGRAGCFASIESVFFLSSVPGLDIVSGDKERR